jgi:hypothetical protein
MLGRGTILTLITAALLASSACSSDSDDGGGQTTCAQNPWSCAGATTCWADAQGAFGCLPAGLKQKGEACSAVAGQADCGSGLFCFQNLANPAAGAACVPFCDSAHPCGAGEGCAQVVIQQVNTTVMLCISQTPGAGGTSGAGGSAGAGGSGAEAGAAGSAATGGAGGSAGGSPAGGAGGTAAAPPVDGG